MGELWDAPNQQAVGQPPPWEEGTGGKPADPAEQQQQPAEQPDEPEAPQEPPESAPEPAEDPKPEQAKGRAKK